MVLVRSLKEELESWLEKTSRRVMVDRVAIISNKYSETVSREIFNSVIYKINVKNDHSHQNGQNITQPYLLKDGGTCNPQFLSKSPWVWDYLPSRQVMVTTDPFQVRSLRQQTRISWTPETHWTGSCTVSLFSRTLGI